MRVELGPANPESDLDEVKGRQGRATNSKAEADDHARQLLPLDCEMKNKMGDGVFTNSESEPGVLVSVTVVRYVDTSSKYDSIHNLLFAGVGRASGQALTEAGK